MSVCACDTHAVCVPGACVRTPSMHASESACVYTGRHASTGTRERLRTYTPHGSLRARPFVRARAAGCVLGPCTFAGLRVLPEAEALAAGAAVAARAVAAPAVVA